MKGKKVYTEETALIKLREKRDIVIHEDEKKIMVLRKAINPSKHVGNGTLGILDYLQKECDYFVHYLNNDLNGNKKIKEFKKAISNRRYGSYTTL